MAFEYPGNAIPGPSFTLGNSSQDLELMFSMVGYTQKGVSLLPGQGIIPLGTVIGQVTASKLYKVYASGNSDGSQNPVGLLRQTVDTGVSGSTKIFQNNVVIKGTVKNSLVSGADSNAITKLGARVLAPAMDAFDF